MTTFVTLYHKLSNQKGDIEYNKIYDKMINEYYIITQNLDHCTDSKYVHFTSCMVMNTFKNKFNIKDKFNFFQNYGLNMFTSTKDKSEFLLFFSKIQNLYNKLNRLVFKYKLKRAKIANHTDICLTPIKSISNVFKLHVKGTIYLFSVLDLKNIIQNSLTNTDVMFSVPLTIKNPYDNQPIDIYNLYNIYNFFKYNYINVPLIFQLYYLSNFNIVRFQKENEVYIRKYLLEKYLQITSIQSVIKNIKHMLYLFNNQKNKIKEQILLDDGFPDNYLYDTFKNYAHIYYISRFSLDLSVKEDYKYKWINSLIKFRKNNNNYGRVFFKLNGIKTQKMYNNENKLPDITDKWGINNDKCHLDYSYVEEEEEEEEDEDEDEEEDEDNREYIEINIIQHIDTTVNDCFSDDDMEVDE